MYLNAYVDCHYNMNFIEAWDDDLVDLANA